MKIDNDTPLHMESYLAASEYIDWTHSLVAAKASMLASNATSDEVIAKICFEFVRDSIKHSWDFQMNPVTCKASEVLIHGTGYCYAKSHLLAALLRANGIPAGLCYQRLTLESEGPPYCLHGLNAVYLEQYGWYQVDARGNKSGVSAEFCPPQERLAYHINDTGERDFHEILSEPHLAVIQALCTYKTVEQVYTNLPDLMAISPDEEI
ncbi:MAG: transglutaminase family protein [Candidatus Nitrotoga sp.]|nr:transglutaminase family protein [Candidatus Nitrotoga sp.]MDP1855864.1 transglutaminase family protein [Candidatus Nitrotoga sp.]